MLKSELYNKVVNTVRGTVKLLLVHILLKTLGTGDADLRLCITTV